MPRNKILIVNNEPEITNTLSTILRPRNFLVSVASGGTEGLAKAKDERPDLILLEAALPDINGYEVCVKLRADKTTRDIPVIMISANGGSESVLKARTSGANDYIVKPFNLFTLLNKLKKVLV